MDLCSNLTGVELGLEAELLLVVHQFLGSEQRKCRPAKAGCMLGLCITYGDNN